MSKVLVVVWDTADELSAGAPSVGGRRYHVLGADGWIHISSATVASTFALCWQQPRVSGGGIYVGGRKFAMCQRHWQLCGPVTTLRGRMEVTYQGRV